VHHVLLDYARVLSEERPFTRVWLESLGFPERFSVKVDTVSAVDEAIEDGVGKHRIPDCRVPMLDDGALHPFESQFVKLCAFH